MDIRGIDFVYYSTTNIKMLSAWYERVLGLKNGTWWSEIGVEYELPDGNTFALYGGPEVTDKRNGTVAFNVENLLATVRELMSQGVEICHEEETPVCRMAFIADPDGNSIMLHEKPKL